jgi:tRNA(fMet)-specific endonuclease VapC
MLDTNIVVDAMKGDENILSKLFEYDGKILISAINLVELHRGVYRNSARAMELLGRLNILIKRIPVLPFDEAAVVQYGLIIAQRGFVRSRDADRMIAAHVLAVRATLITNNAAGFQDVPNLKLENWAMA